MKLTAKQRAEVVKISKRVREEAALICAIGASAEEPMHVGAIENKVGMKRYDAGTIAAQAYCVTRPLIMNEPIQLAYAEAESLLRDGWSPGDEL